MFNSSYLTLIFLLMGCSSDSPVDEGSRNILVKSITINGGYITDGVKPINSGDYSKQCYK